MSLRVSVDGPVLTVTLDRPKVLNAIDPETHTELVAAWTRLREDPELRVAVLTGTGPKAFCAGIDVSRLDDFYAEERPGERRERWARSPGLGGLTRNFRAGKPVISAIRGYCLGLGLELALATDLRIATPDATFGLPELRWGIIPGQGGTQRLARAVPPNVALEMILAGTYLPAARALELGLINRVVPPRRLLPEAMELAARIADRPPRAVHHALEAVRRGLDLPLALALELEQDLAEPLRSSPESRKARSGFGRVGSGRRPR
jgi:enoyl-CoA hydratase/carnithine racemase